MSGDELIARDDLIGRRTILNRKRHDFRLFVDSILSIAIVKQGIQRKRRFGV